MRRLQVRFLLAALKLFAEVDEDAVICFQRAVNYDDLDTGERWELYVKDRRNIAVRNVLITCNLPLIYRLVTRYSLCGFSRAELISAAVPGLIYAVEHYDPSRKTRFSVYCCPFVRGQIRVEFQTKRGEFSRRMAQCLNAIHQAENTAYLQGKLTISAEDVANQTGLGLGIVTKLFDYEQQFSYLPNNNNAGARYHYGEIEKWADRELLQMALNSLSVRLRKMVCRRYVDDWNFREIGEEYGMSRQRAQQLVTKGLSKMREFLEEKGIVAEDINI